MTIFKKGEALNTLVNVSNVMDLGIENLAKTYCAVNRREKGMINFSFLLMEWIEVPEENNWDTNIFNKGIDELVKIHNLGYYHGDFNPTNILKTKDNRGVLIDTQLKRIGFTKYKAHYDMITLQYDSWREMEYPYKKDIIYWLAYGVKRFKRLSLIRKIKKIRRGKREE